MFCSDYDHKNIFLHVLFLFYIRLFRLKELSFDNTILIQLWYQTEITKFVVGNLDSGGEKN